jgi:hypothetical protein
MKEMQVLTDFYETIAEDARIGATHICLYVALLHEQSLHAHEESIHVKRHTLMKKTRISRRTYNKCMNELRAYGYIKYEPSSNPLTGSRVSLNRL